MIGAGFPMLGPQSRKPFMGMQRAPVPLPIVAPGYGGAPVQVPGPPPVAAPAAPLGSTPPGVAGYGGMGRTSPRRGDALSPWQRHARRGAASSMLLGGSTIGASR